MFCGKDRGVSSSIHSLLFVVVSLKILSRGAGNEVENKAASPRRDVQDRQTLWL